MQPSSKHLDGLVALIATEIAASSVELDGFEWCGLPQPVIAAELGFSVETLRRRIAKPPFGKKRRKNVTLLRVGEPGPQTNYDRAQIMSTIWRKKTGKATTLHQFYCLLGLAGEWPDGKQVDLFNRVLTGGTANDRHDFIETDALGYWPTNRIGGVQINTGGHLTL